MEPLSTNKYQNVHPDPNELFLGFLGNKVNEAEKTIQMSFFGGQPKWLYVPQFRQLVCNKCLNQSTQKLKTKPKNSLNQNEDQQKTNKSEEIPFLMTFIGQIYCPLDAERIYHRIIYIFSCQSCHRSCRAIRQQSSKNWVSKQMKNSIKLQTSNEYSMELETQMMTKKQYLKIINQSKSQVEQEIIEQQNDEQDQDLEQNQEDIQQQLAYKLSIKQKIIEEEQEIQKLTEEKQNTTQPIPKDVTFQTYRKAISKINFPVVIYGSTPLQYNQTILNPKHQCTNCSSPLKLEIQITQQLLSMGSKQLALMDWGALFIYTCVGSCQAIYQRTFQEEQVVVQYELDAIKEEEVKQLIKKTKNRKKQKQRKSKSKSRNKNKSKQHQQQEQKHQTLSNKNVPNMKKSQNQQQQQQGDWD